MSTNLGARVAGFTVLGLVALVGAAWVSLYLYAGDVAPRNARVEGVSVAGLAPAEAEKRLRAGLAARTAEPIELTYGDGRDETVDPVEAGLAVDYPASIAKAGGGSGWGIGRMWQVITGGKDHRAVVRVNQSRMQPTLEALDGGIKQPPVQGSVVFRDGEAVARLSRPGLVVDRSDAQALLEARFLRGGSKKIPTVTKEPDVTDEAVRRAMTAFAEPAMSAPVTLVVGGQQVKAAPKLYGKGLSMVAEDGELVPAVDGERVLEALAPVLKKVGREPQDARIVVRRGKPRVIAAKVGVELDPQEVEDELASVLVESGADRTLALKGKESQPEFTTAEAKALKVVERVSTFTTNFPYAEYRNVNLTRAAELIDGTLLLPGETFSLNGIVGERTKENGFTEGYVISDGIFRKDLGGGVSQIATTAFNAMFFAGLEDVEHKPHSVFIDRYPEGREATVAWPSLDLKFTNDTEFGVLVEASVTKSSPSSQGAATVSMYSTKQWNVTSTTGARTDFRQPQVRYLTDEDCEEFSGTQGFSVNVFRRFQDLKTDKVLRTEKFETDYIAGDEVRCGAPPKPAPQKKPKPGRD